MKNSENPISVADFCRVMDVDKTQKHLLNARCSQAARDGKIQRERVFGVWLYKESDLLETLSRMTATTDTLPDDVITVSKYIHERLPLNFYHIKHRIGKRMSELALRGEVKRYSSDGRCRYFYYHLADLEREVANLVKLSNKRADRKMAVEPNSKPGIFVRLWRWLFGN